MSFWDDVGDAFGDAGKVLANTATGAATGFAVGGPLGAILGGAYGTGKGIYTLTSGGDFTRSLYQTAIPAAVIGLGIGAATGKAVASNTALAKDFGYTPGLKETLSTQTGVFSNFFGAAGSAAGSSAGLGGNLGGAGGASKGFSVSGFFGKGADGLAKYAASGALIGVVGKLFGGASGGMGAPSALSLPGSNSLTSIIPAAGFGAPESSPAPAPEPVQAGVNPLVIAAAIAAGLYLLKSSDN